MIAKTPNELRLLNKEERRKYWKSIIEEVERQRQLGISLPDACKKIGVVRQTYSVWKSILKKQENSDVTVIEYKSTSKPKVAPKKLEIDAAVFTAAQVHALLREFVR